MELSMAARIHLSTQALSTKRTYCQLVAIGMITCPPKWLPA